MRKFHDATCGPNFAYDAAVAVSNCGRKSVGAAVYDTFNIKRHRFAPSERNLPDVASGNAAIAEKSPERRCMTGSNETAAESRAPTRSLTRRPL